MAKVELRNIHKSFGSARILSDINLTVADGEFVSLVGPSGCGKTTLIRIISGLENQTSGSILIDGTPIDHLRPHERGVAMVFQSYALYPHMTTFENMAVPLTVSRLKPHERLPLVRLLSGRRRRVMAEIEAEVKMVASQLRIESYLDRKPAQLSGGQRQRVALGRAMVRQPGAFLMDEPLSNLDAKLRVHMRSELADLHKRLGATFIYVTHDQVEAMTMSDKVAMMDGGNVMQFGTPAELYRWPANLQVAQFIGSPAINLLPAVVGKDRRVELLGRQLPVALPLDEGSAVTIGIRPEAVVVGGGQEAATATVRGRVHRIENLGAEQILHFDLEDVAGTTMLSRIVTTHEPENIQGSVELGFDLAACHFFDTAGMRVEASEKLPSKADRDTQGPVRLAKSVAQ